MSRPSRRVGQFLPLNDYQDDAGVDNGADGIDYDSSSYKPVLPFGVPAIDYGTPAEGTDPTAIRTDATLTPPDLDELGQVNVTTPADGDVLTWDSTPGEWVALAPSGGGGVTVQDEGSPLTTTATTLDFVGAGVTATGAGATKTITIPGGGGGGSTIGYGSLKPATPTYDFAGASDLSGWTAVSNAGSFGTGNCYPQAFDGTHLSMGYQAQSGFIYNGVSNTNMTVTCGGMFATFGDAQSHMMGIAVLNTSNTGVGLVVYNDGNAYLANIVNGAYSSLLQTFTGYGHSASGAVPTSHARFALRINRSTNSWTGQISMDGNNWLAASSSSSVTITAARVAVGLFWDPSGLFKGRLFVDWLNVA